MSTTAIRTGAGQFQPGVSGNPAGRPRALRSVVRYRAEDIADAALAIARDADAEPETRLEAVRTLVHIGWPDDGPEAA